MKFPLFKEKPGEIAQAQLEKLLAESLRLLGQAFSKMAEVVESQSRAREEASVRFLQRVDPPDTDPKSKKS